MSTIPHPTQGVFLGRTGENRIAVCSSWNHPQWPLQVEQAEALPIKVAALMCQGSREIEGSCHREEMICYSNGGSWEKGICNVPIAMTSCWWCWTQICECWHSCLHESYFALKVSFNELWGKIFQFYVFLYPGKKFEHTSSPCGERFLFSSCQNTRVIWVFLSSFPDACFELIGWNRSNLLCWHFPPPTAQRVSLCRYIIISFPEETALLKIEQMGWEIFGLNQRSNLSDSCERE